MKKTILFAACVMSLSSYAQIATSSISLKKGQEINMAVSTESETEMSMGMTMKNNTNTATKLTVIGENPDNYILTNSIVSMKMTMDGMGQSMSYDSQKPEDKDSEIGKSIEDKLKSVDTLYINKVTGKLTSASKSEDKSEGSMGGMMGMMGGGQENQSINDAFLMLPAKVAVGYSWSDSSTVKSMKSKNTYTVQSIENGIANVKLTGVVDGTTEIEAQGNTINMTMNTKIDGNIYVDTKSCLVTKKVATSDITGNMEVMGQQMPITVKVNTTVNMK
jgi:hypothetical protein